MRTLITTSLLALLALPFGISAESYSYDTAGRLASVSYDDGSAISYSYDATGNRLSRSITLPPDGDSDGVPDALDPFPTDPTSPLNHTYTVGLNLVPLSVTSAFTSSTEFANAIETGVFGATVIRILGFDATSQTFKVHQTPLNFTLTPGESYFVLISGAGGNLQILGDTAYASLDIANGLTFLALEPAAVGTLVTSADMEAKLETQASNPSAITRILGWDAVAQSFRVHQGPLNYPLNVLGEGTIVFSNTAFTYTP